MARGMGIDASGLHARQLPILNIVSDELKKSVDELTEIGVKEVQRIVKTNETPFGLTRTQYGLGGMGRIRTGKMYNSIGSLKQTISFMPRNLFGFIKGGKESYYYYQEYGFKNVWRLIAFRPGQSYGPNAPDGFIFERWAGKKTEGMHSLRDARQLVLDKKMSVLARAKKNIAGRARSV